MSELDEYVIQTPQEVIEVIESQKTTKTVVTQDYKTIADFKPIFTDGTGPLYAKYPDPCTICHAEHSVTKNGTFCSECEKKMSFNSYLGVYGSV